MTKQRGRMTTREVVLLGLLGAILFVTKLALAWLPNIEPVSLLVMVYAVVLGRRSFLPIYIYAALECMIWGLNFWSVCYLYVWAVLALCAMALRRMESPLGWAVLAGAFGLCFGALCSLVYLVAGGWQFALTWWMSGIPFDLFHCVGNFFIALVLFSPCKRVLTRLVRASAA